MKLNCFLYLMFAVVHAGLLLGCQVPTKPAHEASSADISQPDSVWSEICRTSTLVDLQRALAQVAKPSDPEAVMLHHFTMRHDAIIVQCVSGTIYGTTYYFLLRNGTLDTVFPARAYGTPLYLAQRIDPFDFSLRAIDNRGLAIDEWHARISQDRIREARVDQAKEPLFLLELLFPTRTPTELAQERRFERLAAHYDGTAIHVGTDADEVAEIVGDPRFTVPMRDGTSLSIHGQDADVGWWAIPWLFIEYNEERVAAVYTWWSDEPPTLPE